MNNRLIATGMTLLSCGVLAVAAGPATAATHGASAQDETWLTAGMQGDRFEILGGRLAASHSTNAAVKALGRRLLTDHTASLHRAASVAHDHGVDVPREPTPSEQWELDQLAGLRGSAFDRAYTSLEVKDHQQDISEATDESQGGSSKSIVRLARQDIGMYHRHLALSEKTFKSVG